jgi:hypothetical protein
MLCSKNFSRAFGVDFSGARLAGRTAWLAEVAVDEGGRRHLTSLASLEARAGDAVREVALAWLVAEIRASRDALWGIDAPFGLPVELAPAPGTWRAQLAMLAAWSDGAIALGRHLAARALAEQGVMHVRRETDRATRTPFDSYHYRIIHQTFHAMRDVLLPLSRAARTAVLPFQYRRLADARRVVVETCPSSTLWRLGLPRRGYKQPAGGPITAARSDVRRAILRALRDHVRVDTKHVRVMLADPGGDAIDAVLAAVGAHQAYATCDHAAVARDARAVREGWVYA